MATLNQDPVVKVEMLIRRPAAEVFEAFADPAITTKFWFTHSTGRLETGREVRWDWAMYGVSTDVRVKEIETNKRILIEWDNGASEVEWTFESRSENETFVTITNSGFPGDGDDKVNQALDSMGGFTMVICAAKALLEHGIVLTVVADKAPDAHVK